MTEEEQDLVHLRRAIDLAAASIEAGGGPFGAVVARGAEVAGEGFNRVVTTQDPTAHAEIVAIREACRRLGTHVLAGWVLYSSCEPCPMCLGAAWWARVDRMTCGATREDAARAGFDDAALYAEVVRPLDARVLRLDFRLRDEASDAMRRWAGDRRATLY